MPKYAGAFRGCKWCGGNGCLMCDQEREKAEKRAMQPILTVSREDLQDPEKGARIRAVIGAEALLKAFGPGGRGIQEVEENAAIYNLTEALRKGKTA